MNRLANLTQRLFRGMAELSPRCQEAVRLQSEALDRRLPIRQRLGLRLHLILCKWCRRYGGQIKFLRSAAPQHAQHEEHEHLPSQCLAAEARERIRVKRL